MNLRQNLMRIKLYRPACDCRHSSLCFRVEFSSGSTCVASKCDAVQMGVNLILFSLSFFNLAALFKSSPSNTVGVHRRRGRNAHNRVKRKQLLLQCRRIVLFFESFIDFRVVVVFCRNYLLCFHAVAVSLSASMHFQGL